METSSRPRAISNLPPRRSLTEPIQQKLGERRVSYSGPPDPRVEVLYHHPNTRIVAFTASSPAKQSKNEKSTGEPDEHGTLPWSSRLESTIAIGQMRIYRPPGSVAFLSCGSVLKPILPKSQCWGVDEEGSKFVLVIKRPQYWRIELSSQSPDDKAETEEFKKLLITILFFEKTKCPFARGFTVELPEPPPGPIVRRPWRPVEKTKTELVSVIEIPPSEDVESQEAFYSAPSRSSSTADGEAISQDTDAASQNEKSNRVSDPLPSGRSRNPSLTVITSHQPTGRSRPRSSSTASFHSTQSWHSPLSPFPASPLGSPPSPPSLLFEDNILLPKHRSKKSNYPVPPETPGSWGPPSEPSSRPSTPNLLYPSDDETKSISTMSEISTPPPARKFKTPLPSTPETKIRHRATTASPYRCRPLSPLPPPASILAQRQNESAHGPRKAHSYSNLQAARQIPGIVMCKTCEILLALPSHLNNLILGIAAKISVGEWRGGWLTWSGDVAFEVLEEEEEEEDLFFDDYGFESKGKLSLSGLRGRGRREVMPGGWEFD